MPPRPVNSRFRRLFSLVGRLEIRNHLESNRHQIRVHWSKDMSGRETAVDTKGAVFGTGL